MRRGRFWVGIAVLLAMPALAVGALYFYGGAYAGNVVLRRGGTLWVGVEPHDQRLSPSMRLALAAAVPEIEPGTLEWQALDAGFAVGELPVQQDGREVDRLLLARLDPERYRFVVRTAPAGDKELGDWMRELGAILVINGSYYARDGTPATPVLSRQAPLGPHRYAARHGAFVASPSFTGIRDLRAQDWEDAFRGAEDGMVSYPLLVAADGSSRTAEDRGWLANRSFVAEDSEGAIILGTTTDAFFTLERLARFLKAAPLGLRLALNLDGGPVGCQGIAFGAYRRDFCGRWELAKTGGAAKLWTPAIGARRVALPVVLAALPK